jgi:hypothetical protein
MTHRDRTILAATCGLTLIQLGCVSVPLGQRCHVTVFLVGFGVVRTAGPAIGVPEIVQCKAVGLTVSDQPGLRIGLGCLSSTTTCAQDPPMIAHPDQTIQPLAAPPIAGGREDPLAFTP